ncbi:dual specificity protein phosphatase family protein [bacterium]|nr:dual specificity protein phosphatase family protein [bacterium]
MHEAWLATLNHSEWAEQLRVRLRVGRTDLDDLIAQGPPVAAWQQWLSSRCPDQARQMLTHDHELHCQWQNQHAARGNVLVPLTRIDDYLWRGPQPDESIQEKIPDLKALINLRPEDRRSQELSKQLGLDYLHVPVQDMSVPSPAQVQDYLAYCASLTGPALVHCFAGQGRTGLFVAAYRIFRGHDPESAILLTNQETGLKGMRPCQAQWIRENGHLCIPSK